MHGVVVNIYGETPLMLAAAKGDVDVVCNLLARPAHRRSIDDDSYTGTALSRALNSGNDDVVRALADAGANLNAGYGCGITPLIFATMLGETDTVRLLLELGADPWAIDEEGSPPLHFAAALGDVVLLSAFLERPPLSSTWYDVLWCLKQLQHPFASSEDFARVLFPYLHRAHWVEPADVRDVRDDCGRNALDIARIEGHIDTVTLLRSFCKRNGDKGQALRRL